MKRAFDWLCRNSLKMFIYLTIIVWVSFLASVANMERHHHQDCEEELKYLKQKIQDDSIKHALDTGYIFDHSKIK